MCRKYVLCTAEGILLTGTIYDLLMRYQNIVLAVVRGTERKAIEALMKSLVTGTHSVVLRGYQSYKWYAEDRETSFDHYPQALSICLPVTVVQVFGHI